MQSRIGQNSVNSDSRPRPAAVCFFIQRRLSGQRDREREKNAGRITVQRGRLHIKIIFLYISKLLFFKEMKSKSQFNNALKKYINNNKYIKIKFRKNTASNRKKYLK